MRWPSVALLVLAVSLATFAGCGGDSDESSVAQESKATERKGCGALCQQAAANQNEDDYESAQAAEPIVRAGCAEYCQQAGGYGDAGETGKAPVTLKTDSAIEPLGDGSVPLELTCVFSGPCSGALLLNFNENGGAGDEVARVDLEIDAGASQKLAVPLSSPALRRLSGTGRLDLLVTIDVFPSLETLPLDQRGQWHAVEAFDITLASGVKGP